MRRLLIGFPKVAVSQWGVGRMTAGTGRRRFVGGARGVRRAAAQIHTQWVWYVLMIYLPCNLKYLVSSRNLIEVEMVVPLLLTFVSGGAHLGNKTAWHFRKFYLLCFFLE